MFLRVRIAAFVASHTQHSDPFPHLLDTRIGFAHDAIRSQYTPLCVEEDEMDFCRSDEATADTVAPPVQGEHARFASIGYLRSFIALLLSLASLVAAALIAARFA